MEHRDQRQKSHGVHVCNKCGWHFPNPHPSAKRRRAHKRVCGTIEGFKLVESEANTLVTVTDDDGDHKTSSSKVLGGCYIVKGVDGTKTKSKASEDEMFSDAVAEFSEEVRPNKSMGDALDSLSTSKMAVEDEMSSSRTLKDREVLVENSVVAEAAINQSGSDQENKSDQEFVNLETNCGTASSSSSTVAQTAIDQSGNEQEGKINQELVDLETDFGTPSSSSSTENQQVESSAVAETTVKQSGTEQDTKINQDYGNLETNFRAGNSVIPPIDHMNTTTTTGDSYLNEPETIVPALQQEWNIDSVENMPQCFLSSPDRRYDEKKNEDFDLCKNFTETAASTGKTDNNKSEPLSELEETVEIPREPLQSVADNDMSIHSEMPQSVVSDVKPIGLTQVSSDARKELESCSSNNLLETNKIKEENNDVHLPSVSSDLNIVDHPEASVEDSKDHDHKEVESTNCFVHDPHESCITLQAEPFDQTSEVASFDTKTVENRQKQESGVENVSVDMKAEEVPIQDVNAAQIKGMLGENEKYDKKLTISDATNFGIDSIPSEVLWIDSTPEPTTNSRENKCNAVAEEIADGSARTISLTESTDSKKFNASLAPETQESVKEDDHSNESVTGRSDSFQDGSVVQLAGVGNRIASETGKDDGVKIDVEPRLTSAVLDASVDAISQTDSLEGNWGSVSVLSTLSDLPAVVDGEVTQQARTEAGETILKKANAATEGGQHSNRSDMFEAPSFMTLVEPNGGGIQQNSATREQPNSASLQAGWFPSYTHVANDSPGKKKNEAIIAKVTNWSAGKPHTALKNLLDDAALENKQKSPTRVENLGSMIHKDEKPDEKTVNAVTQAKSPASELRSREIANEWNSPARYPSDIRRERRKGRPYWAQFVCCSSVH
ncbi:uncharacterized protein LOC111791434 isoform X2 [Cucurbita pepo subsp. pepo]|uniref:uncharacterized protein LOC111791434 isoform X2 n=1 Tax=Cucurbita pepo subsp. pepo TaxID=3664 RepID=UPI000C9D51C6|nr:uncharacterized protein LOC111791434 isoform X2 [Cucurbita pepo subsp. pepo]